jgi:hypothetical protein
MTPPTLRYDNGTDWVEIAPGISKLTMRQLVALDNDLLSVAHAFAVTQTTEAHFIDNAGNVVDWRGDVLGLSVQQWAWWKSRIWQAARDEKIDPEA